MTVRSRYNFTNEVQQALTAARRIALRHEAGRVEPRHLFLGLLEQHPNAASAILQELEINLEALAQGLWADLGPSVANASLDSDLPYTESAVQVMALALNATERLGHDFTGTGHVLLGVFGLPAAERAWLPVALHGLGVAVEAAVVRRGTEELAGESTALSFGEMLRRLFRRLR